MSDCQHFLVLFAATSRTTPDSASQVVSQPVHKNLVATSFGLEDWYLVFAIIHASWLKGVPQWERPITIRCTEPQTSKWFHRFAGDFVSVLFIRSEKPGYVCSKSAFCNDI